MSSALILGEPGSGLTTFVGLLYTAQVRYGTEESDLFRFHADRESIRALMGIYGALGEGRFPEGEVDLGSTPLSFVFGFRRRGFHRSRPSSGEDHQFSTLRLSVGGVTPHDLVQMSKHDAVLDAPFRRLLLSPVLLVLVDASWLTSEVESIAGLPMIRYDAALAPTLDLLRKFIGAGQERRRHRMFPIFIVTKFDRIRPEAVEVLKIPPTPPTSWDQTTRIDVGDRLLRKYLPETARFLATRKQGGVEVAPPVWFYSSLRLEISNGPELRIARRERIPIGGWEPEYPFEEFRSLIEHLRTLAEKLPPDGED